MSHYITERLLSTHSPGLYFKGLHCRNFAEGGCLLSQFHFMLCRYFLGHVACRNLPWQGLFIHSCSSLENHTLFQTKMGTAYTVFRPKRSKNHTLWGDTYLYSFHKGVSPAGGGGGGLFTVLLLNKNF